MTGDAPMFWCGKCKDPVRLLGPGIWPRTLKVVHAATGEEKGPGHDPQGWHLATPTDEDPVLRAEADAIMVEFGGAFILTTRFGIFRADWAPGCASAGAGHYEAHSAAEMRERLKAATAFLSIPGPRAGAVR